METTLFICAAPVVANPIRDAAQLPILALMTPEQCEQYLQAQTQAECEALRRNGETDAQCKAYAMDDDTCDDYERRQYLKPAEFNRDRSMPNHLREHLGEMLGYHQVRNVAFKLFNGVRPESELPGEETPRCFHSNPKTAHNRRKTVVTDHVFYSRSEYGNYCHSISEGYEDYEKVGGRNKEFLREVLHLSGYIHRDVAGEVFFATFHTKYTKRVLCFLGENNVPTAELLDVVVRRMPGSKLKAAEVPVQAVTNWPLQHAVWAQANELDWAASKKAIELVPHDEYPADYPYRAPYAWSANDELDDAFLKSLDLEDYHADANVDKALAA